MTWAGPVSQDEDRPTDGPPIETHDPEGVNAMNTKPVPTTWSDRFGNVIDVSRPTTENIGLLPIGYVIPGCGTVEGVSDTAYRTDNGWWSFDIVHGRPGAATPLVTLDDSCRPTCAARRYPNAECVCAELEALGR